MKKVIFLLFSNLSFATSNQTLSNRDWYDYASGPQLVLSIDLNSVLWDTERKVLHFDQLERYASVMVDSSLNLNFQIRITKAIASCSDHAYAVLDATLYDKNWKLVYINSSLLPLLDNYTPNLTVAEKGSVGDAMVVAVCSIAKEKGIV